MGNPNKTAIPESASVKNKLGLRYCKGVGVAKSPQKAAKLFYLAAKQGHASAQHNLGQMYLQGNGVAKSYQKAATWLRLAADQGLAVAQRTLGMMYSKGAGVPASHQEAVTLFRLAAAQGNAAAQKELGLAYKEGRGVRPSSSEAARWLRKAAEQGDALAQHNLNQIAEAEKEVLPSAVTLNATQETMLLMLASHIMFSQLSVHDNEFLLTQMTTRVFEPGEVIAEQDQPILGMFFIHSGKVRLKQISHGKRFSLGVLAAPASFGESSLIQEDHWSYQINAIEKTVIFEMLATKIRQTLVHNQAMSHLFNQEIGFILLAQRLRGMLGDSQYHEYEFMDIVHHMGVKNIAAGKSVFERGAADPRLYYLEKGEVDLFCEPEGYGPILLARIDTGCLLGEEGALQGEHGIQSHTAKTVSDTTLLVIHQAEVQKILAINPQLHEQLRLHVFALQEKEQDKIAIKQHAEGVDQDVHLATKVMEVEFLRQEQVGQQQVGQESIHEEPRFPLVRQAEKSECAAACLTMICNHYAKPFTLGQIVELSNLSSEGVTPDAMMAGAERLGFKSAAYRLSIEDLKSVKLPGIIGWNRDHYSVIYRITEQAVYLVDPKKNKLKLSHHDFLQQWSQATVPGVVNEPDKGVFIGFNPTLRFEQSNPPKQPFLHFARYLFPYKKYFADALLAALLLNLLGLAIPLFVQTIIDTVLLYHDVGLLNVMLGGMVLVTVLKTVTTVSQSLLLAQIASRLDIKMMSDFYRHILSLPMDFFLTRSKGEIMARFASNQKIRGTFAGSTITIVLSFFMLILYFTMMFAYSVTLTWIFLIFIVLHIGSSHYFIPLIKELAEKIALTGVRSTLIESLNAIETIKATSNELMARASWEDAFIENINLGFQMQRINLLSSHVNQFMQLIATVIIFWFGANQVMEGTLTLGELMAFQMVLALAMGPVMQVVQLWLNSQDVKVAMEKVTDILSLKPEESFSRGPVDAGFIEEERVDGHIVFDKVDFGYVSTSKKDSFIMKAFELTIEPGQHVAFVGAAGCGKSTIAKMILGFHMPLSSGGTCYIDGKDIREWNLPVLRQNIGVVLQDGFLFSGSVAENIALGDPEPNMKQVKEAARLAGADEFIQPMTMGYQTAIGEMGVDVSGGQKQRICIARAIYRRPKIMLFDEATSALDNQTEALVQKNIDQIMVGKTSITIAHRLTTVVNADLVCFIKDGKVMEKGSHQELIDPDYLQIKGYSGLYYNLAASQFNLPPLK